MMCALVGDGQIARRTRFSRGGEELQQLQGARHRGPLGMNAVKPAISANMGGRTSRASGHLALLALGSLLAGLGTIVLYFH